MIPPTLRNTRIPAALALAAVCTAAAALSAAVPDSPNGTAQPAESEAGPQTPPEDKAFVLWHKMNLVDGTPQHLEKYKGKVVLMVNTASKCGLTPQYEALEALFDEYKEQGLVVLAFPANNFAGQEPGTNQEIADFCRERFDVSFPVFEKISVKGKDTHPLYEQLAAQPEPIGGAPKWNFTKFLVDRTGRVVDRFEPRVTPDDERVVARIEELLGTAGNITEAGAD